LEHPAGATDVQRLEADSKFFRILLVVSLIAIATFLLEENTSAGCIAVGIAILCSFRYYDRRIKSTTQAYIHIVTMYRLGKLGPGVVGQLPNVDSAI
jgi:hypothetical protein